jgi:hypothetical protein
MSKLAHLNERKPVMPSSLSIAGQYAARLEWYGRRTSPSDGFQFDIDGVAIVDLVLHQAAVDNHVLTILGRYARRCAAPHATPE